MNILIVDDDETVCASLKLLLKRSNYNAFAVNQPKEVLHAIQQNQPLLILLDMNFTIDTSGKKGLETLEIILENYPSMPVILMTGWATVQLAVQGMKLGAKDFIAKPWDNKQLLSAIKTILSLHKKIEPANEGNSNNLSHIIGHDPAFLNLLKIAKKVSKTNASVLITGESGTGKEVIAEAIHAESLRSQKPFVKVNLGGISTSLFESELFGHKRGAFTDAVADRKGRFEMADGGTIFLDEIGDLALGSQVKLLRVLQEQTFEVLGSSQSKKIDVRVISATNKNLEKMVEEGSFREDLFYRINLIKLHLPPLRERANDIPPLVNFYLNNLKKTYDNPNLRASESALNWLKQQDFPGNIRQLKNLVERTFLVASSDLLDLEDFQQQYRQHTAHSSAALNLPKVGVLSLEEMEIKMIKKALNFHQNNISLTAKSLGLTRSALYRRLEKYNISV